MIRVYAAEDPAMVQNTLQTMQSAFTSVKDQPVESHRYGDLSSDPAHFGVAKQLRDNDPELHENQTMYSCGSLAPKMKRKGTSSFLKLYKNSIGLLLWGPLFGESLFGLFWGHYWGQFLG